jgi:predicted transglutaminase-like cysteine proteinase
MPIAGSDRLDEDRNMAFGTQHRGIIALIVALCLVGCASSGGVRNEYPFVSPEDRLANAADLQPWASALEEHNAQKPSLYACATDQSACRGRLRTFNQAVDKAAALTPDEQIELVNFYINASRYRNDRAKRLYDEHGHKAGLARNSWKTLYDFLLKGGDCEDYATSKYFMLRELGFDANDLRVVVAYERQARGYHAVLAVRRPDESIWLLDSDNSVKKRSHGGYRYVYAMNEHSVWDHRDDFAGLGAIIAQPTDKLP